MTMLASAIPALLNLLAAILESLFVASPKLGGGGDDGSPAGGSSHGEHAHRDPDELTSDGRAAALREARDFLGLTPEGASDRDRVKRAYKKLSLRHHPDRNGNSPESVETMQKLNHHCDVLLAEIERGEGGDRPAGDGGFGEEDDGENEDPNRGEDEERWRGSRGGGDDDDDYDPKLRGKRGKKARRRRNATRGAAEEEARRWHAKE